MDDYFAKFNVLSSRVQPVIVASAHKQTQVALKMSYKQRCLLRYAACLCCNQMRVPCFHHARRKEKQRAIFRRSDGIKVVLLQIVNVILNETL